MHVDPNEVEFLDKKSYQSSLRKLFQRNKYANTWSGSDRTKRNNFMKKLICNISPNNQDLAIQEPTCRAITVYIHWVTVL